MSKHNVPFQCKKKKTKKKNKKTKTENHRKLSQMQLWDISKGLKNKVETAVVNEPSVF